MTDPAPAARIHWLASYPKSGNTWLRQMLNSYFRDHDYAQQINQDEFTFGIASSRELFDRYLGISSADLTEAETLALRPEVYRALAAAAPAGERALWIKVHDQQLRLANGEWLFPPEISGHAIYIVRDPRDVAVSTAFHAGHASVAKAIDWMCGASNVAAGKQHRQMQQQYGDWTGHIASWLEESPIPTLIVRYEDMLHDAGGELRRVLEKVSGEPVDQTKIARAVEETRFDRLQQMEREQGFRERAPRQQAFFRSGRAGDWVNHLSAAQAAQICDCHYDMMRRFGYLT